MSDVKRYYPALQYIRLGVSTIEMHESDGSGFCAPYYVEAEDFDALRRERDGLREAVSGALRDLTGPAPEWSQPANAGAAAAKLAAALKASDGGAVTK